MSQGFRRAQLRGSDELFRPTRPDRDAELVPSAPKVGTAPPPTRPHADEALGVVRHEGRLIRLTDEEVDILADALQRMKYPTSSKPPTKPPMDVYERLEELRQKVLGRRG